MFYLRCAVSVMQRIDCVLLLTQEKWDHLTRRWRENISIVHLTRLFLIDEVRLAGFNPTSYCQSRETML